MSHISPRNRRIAAFVSLLYLFFSTFGAMTHSHAPVETAPNSSTACGARQTSIAPPPSYSAPAHCPVCDWQSLQVMPPAVAPQVSQPLFLRVDLTLSDFRLPALPSFRSSSRGPPLA